MWFIHVCVRIACPVIKDMCGLFTVVQLCNVISENILFKVRAVSVCVTCKEVTKEHGNTKIVVCKKTYKF